MRMKWLWLVVLILLVGCSACKRCQGQEVSSATDVISATEVREWKVSIQNGLNKLTGDAYGTVCDLLLVYGFGVEKIPSGTETAKLTAVNKVKMKALEKQINAALGAAYVRQAVILDDDSVDKAIAAAIETATDTFKDERVRAAFIRRAQALRR